jgi:enamine deaminase RidA (YjgF/YER057c/UK114 family)
MKKFHTPIICLFLPLLFTLCSSPNKKEQLQEASILSINQEWDANKKVEELGIDLPEVSAPVANYVNAVRTGNLIFLSGKGPKKPDGTFITGKVGADLSIEEGYEAGRLTAIEQLAVLKDELGDLNKVKRVVKVLGMVNCSPDFKDQPKVVNGYSDLMVAVFGDKGKHARAAVGMVSLPGDIAIEVEMIVEIED